MYVVDGYKMAEGTATFQHKNIFTEEIITVSVNSVFLYRPDTHLWYVAPCKEYPWGCAFRKGEFVQIEEAGGKTIHD